MTDVPGQYGLIGYGDGKIVLPSPAIDPDENLLYRDYGDGTFTWDEVAGLEPTPDNLGYQFVEAVYYRLEITPDLGWSNTQAMFEPYIQGETEFGNARLVVLENLARASDLTVNGDGTLSYTVPEDTMRKILAPGYKKYLWRVCGVSNEFQEGEFSPIQMFYGRVTVEESDWSIEEYPAVAHTLTALLTGKKSVNITSIEINGVTSWTTFENKTHWSAEVPLGPGLNRLLVRAYDDQGNGSPYREVYVEVFARSLSTATYFNKFDDFGALMGVKRLPGERNHTYRTRISDALVHPGGPKHNGFINAAVRELNISYIDQALLLTPAPSATGALRENVVIWMDKVNCYVTLVGEMVAIDEYHQADGNSWRFQLDEMPVGPLSLQQPLGLKVSTNDFVYDKDYNEVRMKHRDYVQDPIYATYAYAEVIPLAGKTIAQFVTALEALTHNGAAIVEVAVDDDLDTSKDARTLQPFSVILLGQRQYVTSGGEEVDSFPIKWANCYVYELTDEKLKATFRNSYGSYFGSRYAAWARQLMSQMKLTWGLAVADLTVWPTQQLIHSGTLLDTVYDPHLNHWGGTANSGEFNTAQAWERQWKDWSDGSTLRYYGIPRTMLHSGIGSGADLFVIVDEAYTGVDSTLSSSTVLPNTSAAAEDTDLGIGVSEVPS